MAIHNFHVQLVLQEIPSGSAVCTVALYRYSSAFFIQRGHRHSLPISYRGGGGDGGHRIKRALYIGMKRLWLCGAEHYFGPGQSYSGRWLLPR